MKKFFAILGITIVGLILYASVIKGLVGNYNAGYILKNLSYPGSPFESSHERSPYALLLALVNSNTFVLNQQLADLGAPDVGFYNSKFYSYFPPGVSVSAIPFYLLGQKYHLEQLFTFAVIPLYSIGVLIFLFLIATGIFKFSIKRSLLTVAIFAFATTALSYSVTIYQHLPSTFFILSAFYFAYRYKKGKRLSFIWGILSATLCGVSVFFDYPNMFFIAPILVFLFFSTFRIEKTEQKTNLYFKFSSIITVIFFILAFGSNLYFNQTVYGSWKTLSNSFPRYEIGKLKVLQNKIIVTKTLDRGSLNISNTFEEASLTKGLNTLVISSGKGILFYSPILVLGIFGIFFSLKKWKPEYTVLTSLVCINFVLYASFGDPWGGWAFGPRYLIPSMPILALFAVKFYEFFSTKRFTVLYKFGFFLVTAFSAAVAFLGAVTTNVIPPDVEAIPGHFAYGLPASINYLLHGTTGVFVYKYYLSHFMSLIQYYEVLLSVVLVLFVILIFWPERTVKNES